MKLHSNEPKTHVINIRCNTAERAMVEALREKIRPKVSASRLLMYLCEEKARELGIIEDCENGEWTICR